MKDLYNNVAVETGAVPATITSSNITTGDIDMQGFDSLMVVAQIGAIVDALDSSNKIELKIEHADDDGAGSAGAYSACADEDVIGFTDLAAGVFKTLDADTDDSKTYPIGYKGGKRFVKVTAVPTSIATGGPVGFTVLKGHPGIAPVSQQT